MRALIVVESYWGNTATLARAVADALSAGGNEVDAVSAADAPLAVGAEVGLVLVGAPTHNMSLPSPSSRQIAAGRGVPAAGPGVREWIDRVELEGTPRILAFDTHVSPFSGSAARTIVKLLRKRRIRSEVGQAFIVAGETPTLRDGELDRASAWGRQLATEFR